MHLSTGEIFTSRGEIYHVRRVIRVLECAQSHPFVFRPVRNHASTNVKCFARKTPQKQGFKTCKIEKINRLAGCKTGDWQGGKNVFLGKNIALAALYASFWWPICMPLTHKGIQIDVLKQCFYPKIRIKHGLKRAEKLQDIGRQTVMNTVHFGRICNDLHGCLQISKGANAMLSRKFSIMSHPSYS